MNDRTKRLFYLFTASALTLLLLAIATDLVAQEAPAAGAPAAAAGSHETKTLWVKFKEGGLVMWPLVLCSIAVVAICIQMFMTMRIEYVMPPALVASVKQMIAQGDYDGAVRTCDANPKMFSKILSGGLKRLSRGRQAVEIGLEEHASMEITKLRTMNSWLATIAVITPMIGLLGTVTGMIKAFDTIGVSGTSDPSKLSAAIGEVLIATATGLFVAVPAFIGYFAIRNRISAVTLAVENKINEVVEDIPYDQLVAGPAGGTEASAPLPMAEPVGAPTAMPVPQTASVPSATPRSSPAVAAVAPSASGPRVRAANATVAVAPAVMVNCPNCNAHIPAGTRQCGACGAALEWD